MSGRRPPLPLNDFWRSSTRLLTSFVDMIQIPSESIQEKDVFSGCAPPPLSRERQKGPRGTHRQQGAWDDQASANAGNLEILPRPGNGEEGHLPPVLLGVDLGGGQLPTDGELPDQVDSPRSGRGWRIQVLLIILA